MDAAFGSGLERLRRPFDVGFRGARERADGRPLHLARDAADRLEVAGAGNRKARLDDIDAQAGQLLGDLDLFSGV